MKKIYFYIIVTCLWLSVNSVAKTMNLLQKDAIHMKSKVVKLTKKHPVYHLVLPANPTTGYAWYIESYDTQFLTLESHYYQKPNNKRIGAGGKETWTLKAKSKAFVAPMLLKIRMIYARPWEIKKGEQQIIYIVTN